MTPRYAPLWCKSNSSFLEGASPPDELVTRAQQYELPSIAITDRDGVYGIVRAHVKAAELSMPLIVGSQITVENDANDTSTIVLLAENRRGYANLCRLITVGRRSKPKGESLVSWTDVCGHADGLFALWGGDESALVRDQDPDAAADLLREAFGNRLYAMAARHRRDSEAAQEARLRARAARYELPIVAAVEVLYADKNRRQLQDVMTCIRRGITVHTAGRALKPNAEHALLSAEKFAALFADDPGAVQRTCDIADRCTFTMKELRYRYPAEFVPGGMTSSSWLHHLAHEGARKRYASQGGVPEKVFTQLEKELQLIDELDYGGYFLTMHDIVAYCAANKILCQGRGSAANSVVCFALGVTAVDPTRVNLLFERFLSKERREPPDIDLDVMHERREEVIQHIYEKYGRSHAAMVANVVRYQPRSAVRDVGKALGLSETMLDRLTKLLTHYGQLTPETLRLAELDPETPLNQHLLTLSAQINMAPRHLSIHPGGFLLGHEPVHDLVPIENATMADRTVIQWDKDDVEALGLFKVDILGLGALTHLDLCFKLLKQHSDVNLTIATIPDGDAPTYEMICKAETVGVFQIESRAQMSMLPRLRPRRYYDLVVQISIVRPGPISGGMVHPYLRARERKRECAGEWLDKECTCGGKCEPAYPHDILIDTLKNTLGVPLFQEQVMKLAIVAADYTPGEADQLRRDMAAWKRKGGLEHHEERLISRMEAKGIPRKFGQAVFEQIKGFGEYGFPESHAASFAIISYATSYLRCHYLPEFTCGLLNAQPMGFYSIATIVEDAKRRGLEVRAVDVQQSEWHCTLERAGNDLALRMGLRFVKRLSETAGKQLMTARAIAPFTSLGDAARRTGLDQRSMTALAEAGAFDALAVDRRTAMWDAPALVTDARIPLRLTGDERMPSFLPLGAADEITWDYRAASHSVRGHPVAELRPLLTAQKCLDAKTVRTVPSGRRVRYAGVVILRQRPQTAKNTTFMTLEDETGHVNLVIWEHVFDKYAVLGKTAHWLGVTGIVEKKHNVVHLIADQLWKPEGIDEPQHVGSRDFH